jgi:hypothetical protein
MFAQSVHPRIRAIADVLDASRPIVFLSHGAGQDSAAILTLLTDPTRPEVARTYLPDDAQLVVMHADTQAEHDETVEYRSYIASYCAAREIPFLVIDKDLGMHTGAWRDGLWGQWIANSTIGSVCFPSTCSDSLKVAPFYKAASAILGALYDVVDFRKRPLYEYTKRFGRKLDVLIGFAAGEEHRADSDELPWVMLPLFPMKPKHRPLHKWFVENVRRQYPLIALEMKRQDAQEYLRSVGEPVPRPSLCKTCHWKSPEELEHLARTEPQIVAFWKERESAKVKKHADRARNATVKGTIDLTQVFDDARRSCAGMTTEELYERVFSHGHAVKSSM